MRYQLMAYVGQVAKPTQIIETQSRGEALARCAAEYGSERAGVIALDVDCTFCEDRPVPNAARFYDGNAPEFAACPRCGK